MKGHSIGEIRIGKGSQGVYWNKRINMSFISRHTPVVPFLILILTSLKGRESESILGVPGAIAQLWMDFDCPHWARTSQGRQTQLDGAESHAAPREKDRHKKEREKEQPSLPTSCSQGDWRHWIGCISWMRCFPSLWANSRTLHSKPDQWHGQLGKSGCWRGLVGGRSLLERRTGTSQWWLGPRGSLILTEKEAPGFASAILDIPAGIWWDNMLGPNFMAIGFSPFECLWDANLKFSCCMDC